MHLHVAKKNLSLDDLKKYRRIYLASPYTRYPDGPAAATEKIEIVTAKLLNLGIHSYSPIVFGHPLVRHGVDPDNVDLWNGFNDAMLEVCDCILVARMIGWQSSVGVQREIDFAKNHNVPLIFIHPETLEVY